MNLDALATWFVLTILACVMGFVGVGIAQMGGRVLGALIIAVALVSFYFAMGMRM